MNSTNDRMKPAVICDASITAFPGQAGDNNEERSSQWWMDFAELNPEAVIFDGPGPRTLFDSCIIGYATRVGAEAVLVYDEEKMVDTLAEELDGDFDAAIDYLCFNTFGAYLGDHTPWILRRYEDG